MTISIRTASGLPPDRVRSLGPASFVGANMKSNESTTRSGINDPALTRMARKARRLYEKNKGCDWLVEPAGPVMFFGDLTAFNSSHPRVATAGKNPSHREFPGEEHFTRFPGADSADECQYLSALCRYFRSNPYKRWFKHYEEALLGMGASYYGGACATALHTDIGSVLPTKPAWGELDIEVRRHLCRDGVPFWHCLIEYLQPDIMIMSMAKKWLDCIEFEPCAPWETIHSFEQTRDGCSRKKPLKESVRWYSFSSGQRFLIAYIPGTQTPMGSLSHAMKREAGSKVREYWKESV